MRYLFLFCVLALGVSLAPSSITAQTPATRRLPTKKPAPKTTAAKKAEAPVKKIDPASFFPLLAIRVEGNKRLDDEKVAALTGLEIGRPANQDSFSAAHLRLMDTGLFESVAYRFEKPAAEEGYIVTFDVVETELFYPIRFEDIPAPREDVLAYLRRNDPAYDGKSAATEPALKRYSSLIQAYLASKGTDMKIRGLVWAEQGGDLSVMFRPDTPVPSISDVRFEGSQKIEPLELRRILIQTATGILYTEDRFRTILKNEIVPAYWAIGYLGVQFPKIEAVPLTEEKGVRVTVTVDEGPEFTLKSAHIVTSEFREDDLLKIGKFPVGETARISIVADGIKEILNKCKREGFIKADARMDPKLDFAKKTVDMTVVLDEGPQYLFKALKFEGVDLVNEAGLRKLWSMEPGKPFNALYPDFFLEQLRERQLMESLGTTKAVVDLNERGRDATVTLVFKAPDNTPPPRVPLVRPQ